MLSMNDLQKGTLIEFNGDVFRVVEARHRAMGRGGASLETKLKSLTTGNVLPNTFKPADKIYPAQTEQKKAQLLYREGDNFVFMDQTTYEQFNLSSEAVGDAANFIKDGDTVQVLYIKGIPNAIALPKNLSLKVTYAENAAKGDTANSPTKPITLETGLIVQAPLFIKTGDMVKVDTRTGKYLERA